LTEFLKNLKKLVGRDENLKQLRKAYEDVLDRRGKCILIEGEAGIGKTTLVEYFAKNVDALYIRVQGLVYKSVEPYLPFLEILPKLKDEDLGSEGLFVAPMATTSTESSLFIPAGGDYAEKDELEVRSMQIPERIRKRIVELSEKRPIIIFVDDIQWMDEGSLTVFLYILRSLENRRIMLIGAYRPEDLILEEGEHMFVDILRRIETNPNVERITLRRLNFDEVKILLTQILGYNIPEDVLRVIYEQTDGNPYFINELLKELAEKGLIDPKSKAWNPMITTEDIIIPKTLESLTLRKYDMISDNAKKFIRVAAVYGRDFQGDEIIEIAGLKEEEGIEAIEELIKYDFIVEGEEGYRFKYLQMQRAIYNRMSKIHKRILHKKIAEYLERNGGDVFLLAKHYFLGGVRDKASKYLLEAARYAQRIGAFRTSIWFLKSLLSMGVESDEIYYMLILSNHILGEIKNIPTYAEKIPKDSPYYTSATIFLAEYYMDQAEYKKAYKILENASQNVDGDEKALILAKMAFISPYINRIKTGEKLLEDAWKLAEKDYTKAVVMKTLGVVSHHKRDIDKTIEYMEKAREILESSERYSKHPEMVRILMDLGVAYDNDYRYDKSLEYYEKSKKLADEIGYVRIIPSIVHNLATLYSRLGDYEKALKSLEESIEICRVIDDLSLIALARYNYGNLLSDMGKYEEAIKNYKEGLEYAKENLWILRNIKFMLGYHYIIIGKVDEGEKLVEEGIELEADDIIKDYLRGAILLVKGEIEKCRELFEKVVENERTPRNYKQNAYSHLCDVYAWLGDDEKIKMYLEKYMEWERNDFPYKITVGVYKNLLEQNYEEVHNILNTLYEKELKSYALYTAIPVVMYLRAKGKRDEELEEWCMSIAEEIGDENAKKILGK